MNTIMRIGMDLAKSVFVLYGVDEREHCQLRKNLRRSEVLRFFARLEPCRVGMEAGSGAHYWARELRELGHDARIMDSRLVAPYRHQGRTGKNDSNDAAAICEAVGRPHMRFVPIKEPEQQAVLIVHRVRKALVNEQNRVANQLRGLSASCCRKGCTYSSVSGLRCDSATPTACRRWLGKNSMRSTGASQISTSRSWPMIARSKRMCAVTRERSASPDQWHRLDHRERARGDDRQRPRLQERAPTRGLARARA